MGPDDTGRRFDPIAIGRIVARNLVPVAGILALDWSASTVLLLYFVDTMLSIGVIFAGLMSWLGRGSVEDRWASRLNAEVGYVAGAAFLVAFISVPLGMPLVFVGALAGWDDVTTVFSDPALQAVTGGYWDENNRQVRSNKNSYNRETWKRLWNETARLAGIQ